MADETKVQFDNKREMDAAAFSQAAYVLDQARQNLPADHDPGDVGPGPTDTMHHHLAKGCHQGRDDLPFEQTVHNLGFK